MKDTFLDYFGLKKTPFGKDLSRQELFSYPQLNELEELIQLTVSRRSMGLITSRAGCGKTTACRAFLSELPARQYKIIYLGQDYRGASLFARLANELGLRPELARNYRSFHISKRLENEVSAGGKEIVLVADEAHLLERPTMEELRLLTNSEMDRKSLVSIIVMGQIWIRDRLKYREYEALNQRLSLRYSLEGLSEKETSDYVHHHLTLAGANGDGLFTADALKQIFISSGGILRVINNICLAAMLKAKSLKRNVIDGALVKRVVKEQEDG
ncbi:MAG: AAA family ATPase [Candidatus Obscuribacterales bacterium]|nr:AAA family ATPase [Candidatus Obscuribacterales bacterium]